ncbi:hypothetical protein CR513_55782, partial [Mucuna pruriens]
MEHHPIRDDAYMGGHTQGTQEGEDEVATLALEGPMTRGRFKRIQEEVYQELVMLKGQEKALDGLILYNFSQLPRWLCLRLVKVLYGQKQALGA